MTAKEKELRECYAAWNKRFFTKLEWDEFARGIKNGFLVKMYWQGWCDGRKNKARGKR